MVEVLLSWEQEDFLDLLGEMFWIGVSEVVRTVFMGYAKVIKQSEAS